MERYRKKPVVIEAVKFRGDNHADVRHFVGESFAGWDGDRILISTLEGEMRGDQGDYIIKGIKGEFYPCKPDIFVATYELA